MDQIDEKILSILREDSRTSFVEIAKVVNLSEALPSGGESQT